MRYLYYNCDYIALSKLDIGTRYICSLQLKDTIDITIYDSPDVHIKCIIVIYYKNINAWKHIYKKHICIFNLVTPTDIIKNIV